MIRKSLKLYKVFPLIYSLDMDLSEFFSKAPKYIEPFELFGPHHLLALSVIAGSIIICTLLARRYVQFRKVYRWFMLIMIPLQEIVYKVWDGLLGETRLSIVFSLHLCSAAIILIVIMLVRYNQTLFEIVYFWGLGGAIQALITPDITYSGFPHFRFFQVFFSHGMIIAAVFYFIFSERKKLRKGALLRVLIITNAYAMIVFVINQIAGTNYLFVNRKPDTASLIDALGPWPVYLIWLEVIMVIVFSLLYLPVFIRQSAEKREVKLCEE